MTAGAEPEVVVLAGGTGGAKLARGMADVVGAERLAVIANTGDDIEIYGGYVSPDPDLVSFWLADLIDERGWGLRDDTFAVMDALRALGADIWFNLGDRDLAWCLERARMLEEGQTPTGALRSLLDAIGVRAAVLPASDESLRTRVRAGGDWHGFQEFMIRLGASGPVEGVEFVGATRARPSPQVLAAIAGAARSSSVPQIRSPRSDRSSLSRACAKRSQRPPRRWSRSARSSEARS
jgi:LPPG:FO 2-phospho-L-lactate transferase